MNKIPCYWVQDLLPTYLNHLTGEQTTADIRGHLSACPDCQEMLRQMQEGEPEQQVQNDREIDYLKKIRGRTRRIIGAVVLAAVAALAVPFVRGWVWGKPDTAFGWDTIQVEENQLSIHGSLWSSASAVSQAEITENNGVLSLQVRSVVPLFYRSGSYEIHYTAQEKIHRVETEDGRILWTDGREISAAANKIYQAKTPYIGDVSQVSNLLQAFDTAPWRSISCHMALQTGQEPYGLTLIAEKDWMTTNSVEEQREWMQKYACLLLACVDNLGTVTYENGDGTAALTYTQAEASQQTGQDIKSWATDVRGVQALLDRLGL